MEGTYKFTIDKRMDVITTSQPDGNIDNSENAVATFVAPQIDSTSSVCTVELTVTDNDGCPLIQIQFGSQ